jgi:2-keto-4-pentenoate hydratase/2-oxohepta-3-ene-1,7-dioic acid hydratase in catechol pathway
MTHISFENKDVRVNKIICVGANYAAHNAEMGRAGKPESFLFMKPSTALANNEEIIQIPPFTTNLHHEVEMVLLMGKGGRRIELDAALDHVEAVAAGLDLTARDLQLKAKEHGLPWTMSKGFDGSARTSPFVPVSEVGDLDNQDLLLAINGDVRQQGNTSEMLLNCASLIHYASRFFTLEAGDLLFTGTPAGVGPLVAGDKIEIALGEYSHAEFDVVEEMDVSKC